MNVGSGSSYNSDINVTPMVDVVLVLLIIFMVVTPLTQMGYAIQIPQEQKTRIVDPEQNKQVILAITENDCAITEMLPGGSLPPGCAVRINKERVMIDQLAQQMMTIMQGKRRDEKVIFLASQDKLNYEAVLQILDIARSMAGDGVKVGIVSDEKVALASLQPAQ